MALPDIKFKYATQTACKPSDKCARCGEGARRYRTMFHTKPRDVVFFFHSTYMCEDQTEPPAYDKIQSLH